MPAESSETSTIRIPKKWFGTVASVVSFALMIGGLGAKGCDMHREQILREKAMQDRIERLERWRCAMGSKPQDSVEWQKTDWQRECRSDRQ